MYRPYSPPVHVSFPDSSAFPTGTALPVPALLPAAVQPSAAPLVVASSSPSIPSPCSLIHCSAPAAHPYPPLVYINGIPSSLGDYSEGFNVVQPPGQTYFDCDVSHSCVVFDTTAVAEWLRTSPLADRALLMSALQIPAEQFHQSISADPRQSAGLLLVNNTPLPLVFRVTSTGTFRLAWFGGDTAFVRQRHHSSPPPGERLIPPGESRTLVGNPGGPRFADGVWGVVTVTHEF